MCLLHPNFEARYSRHLWIHDEIKLSKSANGLDQELHYPNRESDFVMNCHGMTVRTKPSFDLKPDNNKIKKGVSVKCLNG